VPRFVGFAVRTVAESSGVIAGVGRAILSEDPNLFITAARPLTEFINERMVQERRRIGSYEN